ncbi:MAG TPA: ribonuclease D [Geminicoccus sp.]|jgi:ribonuclease D|uniref:ribonuclease D n=1 Tax=Geminicoccus sp. TaxID=2024832 RepID=UPI002E3378CF|nr:ribonuclease D [Geminicoccus sp.]HEX2527650.1 ribonuclease D [Geminicoccus sp.]
MLIQDNAALADVCARLAHEDYVTVDTEFMRDKTYYAKLCLVQLGGREEAVAIDALAPGIDLGPLLALMANDAVLKVMHAARQDLEIFWHLMDGQLPRPLVDTQIAAMVLGYGEEVGYEALVSRLTRAKVDKTSRFSDWSHRPLKASQVAYALADVIHLREIWEKLDREMVAMGRRHWLDDEHAALFDPNLYDADPENAWRRLKVRSRDPRFAAVVRALAAWRERAARAKDLPRQRILRDDVLLEIAANKPGTLDALKDLPRVSLDRGSAQAVVDAINEAMELPATQLPVLEPVKDLPKGIPAIVDLLRVLLKQVADEHDISPRLIANGDDLEAVALDEQDGARVLSGWRREVFGEKALALKRGELVLGIKGRRVVVEPRQAGAGRS